jgi:signal transduction histidine kinase
VRSLAFRLAAFSALWLALGLGAAGWFVSDTMTASAEAAFAARLSALLDAAVAGAAVGDDGAPLMLSPPGLPELDRPFSGVYWQLTGTEGRIVTSRSLWDQRLPPGSAADEAVALRRAAGPRGAMLGIAERSIVPAGAASALTVSAALDRAGVDDEVARLRRVITLLFAALGAGLTAVVVAQLLAGLAPLRRARRALARVRAGEQQRLGLAAPSEIAPLVTEIDALIVENAETVARARAHLGNLAHALKTPVAVLRNALDAERPDIATARAEAGRLEQLVQHHLARARAAAIGRASVVQPTPLRPEVEAVAAALRRLFAGRDLSIGIVGGEGLRARVDRTDLAELLGNLMENACKWATARVTVSLARAGDRHVSVTIEDDGPGLSDQEAEAATLRGVRLDEAAPGTGLGLAIVSDLAALHGGRLSLGRAEAGGLSARLTLPGG